MKKATELRQHLLDSVPFLSTDPKKLDTYIERGALAARLGGLSFEYRYEIVLVVRDYPHHADTLMIPLLAWISVHQPSLLQHPDKNPEAIRFEAELLDEERSDIEITIAIAEAVRVQAQPDGSYLATHLPEPPLPDLGGPLGFEIFVKGVPLQPPE